MTVSYLIEFSQKEDFNIYMFSFSSFFVPIVILLWIAMCVSFCISLWYEYANENENEKNMNLIEIALKNVHVSCFPTQNQKQPTPLGGECIFLVTSRLIPCPWNIVHISSCIWVVLDIGDGWSYLQFGFVSLFCCSIFFHLFYVHFH